MTVHDGPPRQEPDRGALARWRHGLFRAAVMVKGVDGLLEIVGAGLLLAFGPGGVSGAVRFLTQHELAEDPRDLLVGLLIRRTQRIGAGAVHFAAAYLFVHGLVKVWLVGGLIRERRWVFPVALMILGLFVVYQVIRLVRHPGGGLLFLTVFDLAIIGLVWREYRALPAPA